MTALKKKNKQQKQKAKSNYLLSSRNTPRWKRHLKIESQRRGQGQMLRLDNW